MAIALAQVGKLDEAIQHYLIALRSNPDDPVAHNGIAVVLAQLGRLEEAIPHFYEALRLMPNNAQVRHNLQRALRLSGKSEAPRPWTPMIGQPERGNKL